MIISRTPFRVSFAGGGSDIADFYHRREGAVLSTTINKFMFLTLHENFTPDRILFKYRKTEEVADPRQLEHPLARAILTEHGVSGIELQAVADIPARTGLGSSSAFTVGLHHALAAYRHVPVGKAGLAERACQTEIEEVGCPIGKQDQYAAAFGGLNFFRFLPDERVVVSPLSLPGEVEGELTGNLHLFYTGVTRRAETILRRQREAVRRSEAAFRTLVGMVEIAHEMREALEGGNLEAFGDLLERGWELKESLGCGISNPAIAGYYARAREAGARGGKLLGAGGGGFLLFYCEPERYPRVRKALGELREIPFRFSRGGSAIVFNDEEPVEAGVGQGKEAMALAAL